MLRPWVGAPPPGTGKAPVPDRFHRGSCIRLTVWDKEELSLHRRFRPHARLPEGKISGTRRTKAMQKRWKTAVGRERKKVNRPTVRTLPALPSIPTPPAQAPFNTGTFHPDDSFGYGRSGAYPTKSAGTKFCPGAFYGLIFLFPCLFCHSLSHFCRA